MEPIEVEVIDIKTELQVFDPVATTIQEAKDKNANLVFDYDDKDGNKAARSWIAQLRKLKAPINEVHKMAKAEAKKFCDALDGKKRELLGVVEEMIEVHHKPIWEIDQKRIAAEAAETLRIKQEEEAAEAKRLAEIEAREKAIAEREAKVQAEKDKLEQAERERKIAEQAKVDAEANAAQALQDAEHRRLADIQRERDRAAAEVLAKERKEAEAAGIRDREAQEAIEHEQARINNEEHRRKIHREIYDAFVKSIGILPQDAKVIGAAIRDGKVPHVTIQY
jgi:hypothetical protein